MSLYVHSSRQARPSRIIGTVAAIGIGLAVYSRFIMSTSQAEGTGPKKIFSGGFVNTPLKLESYKQVNSNTKRLRFQLPESDNISGLPLTSSVLTFSWQSGQWLPGVKPYTPISPSDKPGVVEFVIKEYPNGKQSGYIHSLEPGDTLRFMAVIPGFKWTPNKYPHITLVAGGTGITPVFQLIQGILQNPEDKTKITLVYGVNSDDDVLMKREFDGFASQFGSRFTATYVVSNPQSGSPYRQGRVNKALLKQVMPAEKNTRVFVCGPPPMEEALCGKQGILQQLGYGKDRVYQF